MLWNRDMKQLGRAPLRVTAFCLILAIAIGLCSITAGLADAAEYATQAIEKMYTTYGRVARFDSSSASYGSTSMAESNQASSARVDKINLSSRLINMLSQGEIELESDVEIEFHSWLMAYDSSYMPMSGYGNESGNDAFLTNLPQTLGLFAVTCTEIAQTQSGTDKLKVYSLDVNEIAVLHSDIQAPTQLSLELLDDAQKTAPTLEIGHSYWIWGYYEPVTETSGTLTLHRNAATSKYENYHVNLGITLNKSRLRKDGIVYIEWPYNKSGKPPYFLPVIGEYSGSATEYLQTDAVGMWGELIEALVATVHSLRVCTANDPRCLYPFTEGNTRLIEGAFFTEEQIAQGEKVMIVSDRFAAQNGLSVGDTMNLSFWRTNWHVYSQHVENKATAMPQPTSIVGINKFDYEELTQETYAKPVSRSNGSYTIVGIYQTVGYRDDFRYMHPNTVIVPQSVMSQHIRMTSDHYLDMTVIIPNGGAAALEAELSSLGTDLIETGYGGLMAYDDSGYSSIVPNVKAIRDGTQFVYKISLGLSCIVSLIALILFVSSLVSAGQIKYRLGVGKGRIWWQMTMASVPILLLSGVIGCVGSVLLYGRATEWMLGAEFTSFDVSFSTVSDTAEMLEQIFSLLTQQTEFFMRIAALQVGVLAAVTTVLCALIAWRRIGFQK